MIRSVVLVGALAGFAASAHAQFQITPGGANAGNGYFRNGAIGTSATGTGVTGADLRNTTSTGTDQLFQMWWWYRGAGDTREYTFANQAVAGGPTGAGTLVGNTTNTLAVGGYDFTVTNSTAGYAFTSTQRYEIFHGGTGPQVLVTNVITNTGSNVADLSLFLYGDFDVNGTSGTDTWVYGGNQFTITDAASTVNWAGYGASAYQATTYSTLRGNLSNTSVNNFDNTLGAGTGDYTGGFQWNLVLQPGQSATLVSGIGVNAPAIPAPGALALLGLGGLVIAKRRR